MKFVLRYSIDYYFHFCYAKICSMYLPSKSFDVFLPHKRNMGNKIKSKRHCPMFYPNMFDCCPAWISFSQAEDGATPGCCGWAGQISCQSSAHTEQLFCLISGAVGRARHCNTARFTPAQLQTGGRHWARLQGNNVLNLCSKIICFLFYIYIYPFFFYWKIPMHLLKKLLFNNYWQTYFTDNMAMHCTLGTNINLRSRL